MIATNNAKTLAGKVALGPQAAFVSGQVLRVDGGGQCWPG